MKRRDRRRTEECTDDMNTRHDLYADEEFYRSISIFDGPVLWAISSFLIAQ